VLQGSAVRLPAAWKGTAQVTIAQTGACPGAKPTRYSLAADVALDVPGGGAAATGATSTVTATGSEPTLSIGVNTSGVPSVAVYSVAPDNTGTFHQFWRLAVSPSGTRTSVAGSVVNDESLAGNNPNLLVDDLAPPGGCTDQTGTGLPRVLAVGSTIDGWVDQSDARFTLKAETADGQRALTVTINAARSH
jgi:hypothetical protein